MKRAVMAGLFGAGLLALLAALSASRAETALMEQEAHAIGAMPTSTFTRLS
jgi:hypothetical protein